MIVFLLSQTLLTSLTIVRSNDSLEQHRFLVFDDFREGTKIESAGLKTIAGESKTFCALSCAFDAQCKSFHFCTNKSCKLSSIDANSDDFDFQRDPKCHYMGSKTQEENSLPETGRCKNGEFELPSRHGFSCLVIGDPITKYEFFPGARDRTSAKTHCDSLGKFLLYSLDWTEAGLNNAIKYLGSDNFWVGIGYSRGWRTVTNLKLTDFEMSNRSDGGNCIFSEGSDLSSHLKRGGCMILRSFICEE